jgi:thiamine pyrophosphokinase
MKGLLLTGGDGPTREQLEREISDPDWVVAADSGVDLAITIGVLPDLIVGDMDSLKDVRVLDRYPADRVLRFPQDKDETDTEIGIRLLREKGCSDITVAGGGGGRLAHTLGLLALFRRDPAPDCWITGREIVRKLTGQSAFTGCRETVFSFFPLGPVRISHSIGLQWALDGMEWDEGDVGISNIGTTDRIEVIVSEGALLMVREFG